MMGDKQKCDYENEEKRKNVKRIVIITVIAVICIGGIIFGIHQHNENKRFAYKVFSEAGK